MIDQLYQKAILKQASAATGNGKLEAADCVLTIHNPLCGDRITIYLNLNGGEITEFSHETKACVLCQASASILGFCSTGETEETIQLIQDKLKQKLTQKNWPEEKHAPHEWPKTKWNALNIFQPVSDHKTRYSCVTLPFEAILKALRGEG